MWRQGMQDASVERQHLDVALDTADRHLPVRDVEVHEKWIVASRRDRRSRDAGQAPPPERSVGARAHQVRVDEGQAADPSGVSDDELWVYPIGRLTAIEGVLRQREVIALGKVDSEALLDLLEFSVD